jgi:putative ABC transport system permease protein
MRTPLAWLNLWHDKARTLTALAGAAFAVILVLMQLGFFRSVLHTAGVLYDQLKFDVVISSLNYRQMLKTGTFPRDRLIAAAALPEVADTSPVSIALQLYRNPETGKKRSILVVGVDPTDDLVRTVTPELREQIYTVGNVLLDIYSRPEYGPRYVGLRSQIGETAVHITGMIEIGASFGADGSVITSDATFAKVLYPRTKNDISLGLIKLKPGSNPQAVVARLREMLPRDVVVQTRAEFIAQEEYYWVVKTSVGVIFGLGVVVALLVGTAIVYQVLSTDVAKRMPEYATLKAMGYSSGYLTRVILLQAATIGVVGFIPGWLISLGLYVVAGTQAFLWMQMGTLIPSITFILCVLMCCLSGLAALNKVHTADPAELFA